MCDWYDPICHDIEVMTSFMSWFLYLVIMIVITIYCIYIAQLQKKNVSHFISKG